MKTEVHHNGLTLMVNSPISQDRCTYVHCIIKQNFFRNNQFYLNKVNDQLKSYSCTSNTGPKTTQRERSTYMYIISLVDKQQPTGCAEITVCTLQHSCDVGRMRGCNLRSEAGIPRRTCPFLLTLSLPMLSPMYI